MDGKTIKLPRIKSSYLVGSKDSLLKMSEQSPKYKSIALLSVVAIPAATIKHRERLSFKAPDLLILLFCFAAVLITLNHTGKQTNKCLLLIFATVFYYYLRIFLAGKNKLIYTLCGLAFVITGLVETV
jgi:hypothetical protein